MSIFNLNDVNKIPNIQKTIEGLSKILTVRSRLVRTQMTVLDVPLIITSDHGRNGVMYEGPYHLQKQPAFINAIMAANPGKKNITFIIIANDYTDKGVINSHMLLGISFASGKRIIIIDPNSNVTHLDNIYKGRGFLKAPKLKNLTNPLYNTLALFFKKRMGTKFHMLFYSGEPVVCPAGGARSCAYRTVMIMLGMKASLTNNTKKALEFANFMAQNKFSEVEILLNKIFTNESNAKTYTNNFLKNLNTKNIQNTYISISPSSSSSSSKTSSGGGTP